MAKNPKNLPLRARFLEFFQENNGSFSATRLAFLLWAIGILIVWIIEGLRLNLMQPVSSDVATILGILMTGKVVQKFGEANPDQASNVPDDQQSAANKAAADDALVGKQVQSQT